MNRQEQMEQMIRNEIQSISNLDERIILKELMENVFLSLLETNEQMYQKLEDRVMNDLSYEVNQYLIKTGLVEREFFDPTHHFMTVMQESDRQSGERSVKDVRETIKENGKCLVGTVFLKCDYMDIQSMLKRHRKIYGVIRIDQEYRTSFLWEQNHTYLEKVEQLYHLFIENGVPWQTVNCPYLFKLVDVYVTEIPEVCDDNEKLQNFHIELGALTSSVCYNMIPIWNVWNLKLDSVGFPIACRSHKSYEHEISISEHGAGYVYLVDGKAGMISVRRNDQKIFLISTEQGAQEWNVYSIRGGGKGRTERYTYSLMENFRQDGFAERFQRKTGKVVKTKMELERFIRGFGLDKYLQYFDCRLIENTESLAETYSMNFFLKDEIREGKQSKQLLLTFKPNNVTPFLWLLRDLMSFVVSEVQELYPEYECRGELE